MTGHTIICGYGYNGRKIAEALSRAGVEHVIIDLKGGEGVIEGDAKEEEVLRKAGIEHAREMVIAVSNDEDAVFICLLAKKLNPSLRIVVKADRLESMRHLYLAGADRVFSPYVIAGRLLAKAVIKPGVAEFIQRITISGDIEVSQLAVTENSKLSGRKLRETELSRHGVTVLGVYRSGKLIPNPSPELQLRAGDHLVVLGKGHEIVEAARRTGAKTRLI